MEALERKIRGVYDALEARNDKASGCCSMPLTWLQALSTRSTDQWAMQAAVKAATTALQKHKGNQVLRALKALAQQRSGNEAEALKARWRAAPGSTVFMLAGMPSSDRVAVCRPAQTCSRRCPQTPRY